MSNQVMPGELLSESLILSMEHDIASRAARYADIVGQQPAISIMSANPEHLPSATYMNIKRKVGARLGLTVVTHAFGSLDELRNHIASDNTNPDINGIVVQLPLPEASYTNEIVDLIEPSKDVDGLGTRSHFMSATAEATERWMAYHNVPYLEENVVLRGFGRLTNKPLYESMQRQGAKNVQIIDLDTPEPEAARRLNHARVIITATGSAGSLQTGHFWHSTDPKVVVDIGTAEQGGEVRGDVSCELRRDKLREGWTFTPEKKGVGPITVRTLHKKLLDAAEAQAGITDAKYPIGPYCVKLVMNDTSYASNSNRPDSIPRDFDTLLLGVPGLE